MPVAKGIGNSWQMLQLFILIITNSKLQPYWWLRIGHLTVIHHGNIDGVL
jgi:hypothetical protein